MAEATSNMPKQAVAKKGRKPQGTLRKEWMFTVQTGNLTEHTTLDEWELAIRTSVPNGIKFLVFQQEAAPTTGTHHVQGFVAMSQQKRANQLGVLFKTQPEAFQSTRFGTASQNRGYCTDDDKRLADHEPFEHGEMPGGRGKRNDLEKACDILKEGRGTKRLQEEMPHVYIKFHAGFDKQAFFEKAKRCKTAPMHDVALYVIWGTAGSGKTTWSKQFDPGHTYEMPDPQKGGTTWIGNDYNGERTLLIPDFDGEYPYGTLKRMCDGTYMKFQTKGNFEIAEWDAIVITSNHHPKDWYPNERSDVWINDGEFGFPGPLQRRINNVVYFHGVYPDVTYMIDGGNATDRAPPVRAQIAAVEPEETIAEAPVRSSPSPMASDAHSTDGHSPTTPEQPPPPIADHSLIDSAIQEMLDGQPAEAASAMDRVDDALGPYLDDTWIDDSELAGVVVDPTPHSTGIPPAWLDDSAQEDIVW